MLCPSLLSSQITDPETYLSENQIDRELLVKRLWGLIHETDKTRAKGLTERDFDYFENLMCAIKNWTDEDLLDLASEPGQFRKYMREW
ncbi:hypothetical protein AB4167_17370 [Vibrio sp. 10N.286.49.E11]|uniref:hypothetical protein n=1 Tax=Vibrio sp. 10N.286.49.E11 TaxID=3229703 RepID=UPI0035536D77